MRKRPFFSVENLSAWYGPAQALFEASLHVEQGEVVALLGSNGAGKSTLLKAIMGLMDRRLGRLVWLGEDISEWPTHRIAASGLGYVPEDRRIFTDLTVLENLEVGRQPGRHWPNGVAAPVWDTASLFRLFPNLEQMQGRPGARMSGGEQQMLSVARTLMGNPFLILLDEPSEGVAPVIVEQMAQMILSLKAQGVSVLLSEQNLPFARLVCDRGYVIEKGRIVYGGSMTDLTAKSLF